MSELDDEINKDEVNPEDLAYFLFNHSNVHVCLYEYKDKNGIAYGFLTIFPDADENGGGILRNSVPVRNSFISRPYPSRKKLWKRFCQVRDMTLNRPDFTFLYEGQVNHDGKQKWLIGD